MDSYHFTGEVQPEGAKPKRLRDYGAFQVDVAMLTTQKIPILKERDGKFALPEGMATSSNNNGKVAISVTPLPLEPDKVPYIGPLSKKFNRTSKIVPFPATSLPTDANPLETTFQQQLGKRVNKSTGRKWLSFAFRLALTVLMFSLLAKSLSWPTLLRAFTQMNRSMALVSLVVGAGGVIVSAYQWRSLLLSEKIHIDLAALINLYMIGIGFSHFLPTGMGGDAVKAMYVGRESSNSAGSVSAVVMCRITGFVGMLLVGFPTLLLWRGSFTTTIITPFLLLSLLVGSMIAGAVISVGLLPKLLKGKWKNFRIFVSVQQVGSALYAAVKRPRSLLVAILYGIVFQILAVLNCYTYASALGIQASLHFYCVSVPLIALVAFLPISINGYGLRESTYVFVFSTIHVQPATALLLALLQDAQTLVFGVIGGCIYLKRSAKTKSISEMQESKPPVQMREKLPTLVIRKVK